MILGLGETMEYIGIVVFLDIVWLLLAIWNLYNCIKEKNRNAILGWVSCILAILYIIINNFM